MRNLILFGAGAAIPWGGPSTSDLTKILIKEKEDLSRTCDYRVVRLLYDFLIFKFRQRNGYYEGFVNFEDLINVIEELILYYSESSNLNRDYLYSIFKLSPELEKDLSKFYRERNPIDFWKETLQEIFGTISMIVNRYSSHYSNSNSKIFPSFDHEGKDDEIANERRELNDLFKKWAVSLVKNEGVIRSYTLNYDRLFNELFKWSLEAKVLEGVNDENQDHNEFDLRSILKDRDSHCQYNLHGSIYWHLLEKSRLELNDWQLVSGRHPYWQPDSSELPLITIEQGRSFLLSNIVAGYRKTQRTFLAPFKQIHASFEIDCSNADNLYLIGYSFSDQHINSCIRSYLDKKSNLKVLIIDPKYKEMKNSDVLRDIVITHLPQLFNEEILVNGNHSPNEYPMSYLNGRVLIYPVTFEEYLKTSIWRN